MSNYLVIFWTSKPSNPILSDVSSCPYFMSDFDPQILSCVFKNFLWFYRVKMISLLSPLKLLSGILWISPTISKISQPFHTTKLLNLTRKLPSLTLLFQLMLLLDGLLVFPLIWLTGKNFLLNWIIYYFLFFQSFQPHN